MASSHEVQVLKRALKLACIDFHGSCPDPEECCDITYLTEAYVRHAEEDLQEGV